MRVANAIGAVWCTALVATLPAPAAAQEGPCGTAREDWCAAPAGDPCGRHKNARECRDDLACRAVTYSGPTPVACIVDRRGFSLNCPAVGCRSIQAPETGEKR